MFVSPAVLVKCFTKGNYLLVLPFIMHGIALCTLFTAGSLHPESTVSSETSGTQRLRVRPCTLYLEISVNTHWL